MIKLTPDRSRLFLLVRSHSQIQYYLNVSDTKRAANQNGLQFRAPPDNVAEIHPMSLRSLRRRG
jgi:hypothetical protein